MPIVVVHGVAVRDSAAFLGIREYLLRYVAPELNRSSPHDVKVYPASWGDLGVRFAWDGLSRPRTWITKQGFSDALPDALISSAAFLSDAKNEVAVPQPAAKTKQTISSGRRKVSEKAMSLAGATADERRELALYAILASALDDPKDGGLNPSDPVSILSPALAVKIIAADEAAQSTEDIATIAAAITRAARKSRGIATAGANSRSIGRFKDHISEAYARAKSANGFVAGRLLERLRIPLNDRITTFIGDVFVYLAHREHERGSSVPGSIPQRVLDVLCRASRERTNPKEPLIVLSHSMGGQIIYDIASTFLPLLRRNDPAVYGKVRIDFWAAAASQVALFEEMKVFLSSDDDLTLANSSRVSAPSREVLGVWWNLWDRNDYLSYTAREIFADDGVIDSEYSSGASLLDAHSGYLVRPSFYRRFASMISRAAADGYRS